MVSGSFCWVWGPNGPSSPLLPYTMAHPFLQNFRYTTRFATEQNDTSVRETSAACRATRQGAERHVRKGKHEGPQYDSPRHAAGRRVGKGDKPRGTKWLPET